MIKVQTTNNAESAAAIINTLLKSSNCEILYVTQGLSYVTHSGNCWTEYTIFYKENEIGEIEQ